MTRIAVVAALAVVCAAVVPAALSAVAPPADLNGTAWRLTELPGRALLPDAVATLRFEKGRVTGSNGCNSFMGTYEATADALQFPAPLAGTMRMCPDAVMQQADAFMEVLGKTRAWRVADGTLTLLGEKAVRLATFSSQKFEPSKHAQ